jgi:hypothetical protein
VSLVALASRIYRFFTPTFKGSAIPRETLNMWKKIYGKSTLVRDRQANKTLW